MHASHTALLGALAIISAVICSSAFATTGTESANRITAVSNVQRLRDVTDRSGEASQREIRLAKVLRPSPPGKSGGGGNSGGGGGSGGLSGQLVDLSSATVLVDGATNVSESGADDLAATRGMFRSASYPESNGGLESSAALLNGINLRAIRIINDEPGSYVDSSGNFVPSARLGWDLPWIKRYGYNPHVIVAQRCPTSFPCPAGSWDTATWAAYQEYAYRFVRWVATEYDGTGFPEVMFEVANEVDITPNVDDLWTAADPMLFVASQGRFDHYMNVYRVWSRAVDRVAKENPGRVLKVAGPAMGAQSMMYNNGNLYHTQFVQQVVSEGLRLDVLTAHFYCDVLNGWVGFPNTSLRAQLQIMRQALTANGLSAVPIQITEYGPGPGSDAVGGHINYSHEGAAWGAIFALESVGGTASGGSILNVRDNLGTSTSGWWQIASFNDIENNVEYPKAIYNTFKMFTMMPGTRKAVTLPATLQPDVKGVASADTTSAALIAFNYNYHFNWPDDWQDHTRNQKVVPGFRNLPFTGSVGVERYLVDINTSNVARFLDASLPPDFTASSLTKVESCAASVDPKGSLLLPARTLGPSAVSLWVVKSGGGTGLSTCAP